MAPRQSASSSAISAAYTDVTVYIGRFSPFHLGHAHVLREAMKISKLVIVLIGSAGLSRSLKNPFTFEERKQMIEDWAGAEELRNLDSRQKCVLRVVASRDFPYNDTLWQRNVQRLVKETIASVRHDLTDKPSICITGSDRDESTWYLQTFPQWKQALQPPYRQNGNVDVSATDVRSWLFRQPTDIIAQPTIGEWINDFTNILTTRVRNTVLDFVERFLLMKLDDEITDLSHIPDTLPGTTLAFLESFKASQHHQMLVNTYKFVRDYKRRAKLYPYPPIYQTVDVVIVQSGHVLTVVRGHQPGKGLWALPGGFVNQNERLRDAAIREAIEETGIRLAEGKNWKKITADILRGSIRSMHVLDKPDRSDRGRTISHLFYIRLDDTKPLPIVKGSNQGNDDPECDVTEVMWLPVDTALERMDMWFEDHHAGLELSTSSYPTLG